MPSRRFNHSFANDVFISYTHVDNEVDPSGRRWVSQFTDDLKTRLAQVSGRSVEIWLDQNKLGGSDRFDQEIKDQIARSGVLVPILSPSYILSDYCRKERDEFVRCALKERGLDVGNKARIGKVAKTRVGLDHYPEDLRSLLEYRFYDEAPSGVCREFHLHESPEVRHRYSARIDDVASEIARILAALENQPAEADKGSVYLAETSSDLEPARDAIARALVQRGYQVFPRTPLRLLGIDRLREYVIGELSKCQMSVHPLGVYHGWVPEQAAGKSLIRLQLELAGEYEGREIFPRIIWIPPGLKPQEPQQVALLERARQGLIGTQFELIERPLQELETHIRDRLEAPRQAPPPTAQPSEELPPTVYLMCDRADQPTAKSIRTFLHDRGLDVHWLPESADPAKLREQHEELLRSDDAFLIYYGTSDALWIQAQLLELRRMRGLGRRTPVVARGIYRADPKTENKEDLLTHDTLILDGYQPTPPEQALAPFLHRLAAGRRGREAARP